MVAGDWHRHRHARHAIQAIRFAHDNGVKVIVHVGDFGYRYGRDADNGFLFEKPIQLALEKYDVTLIWIDGNHDNHALLRSLEPLPNGFVKTGSSGRMFYAPRGLRWIWHDRVFAALGGAFSVDHHHRKEGFDLFAELEEVSRDDLNKLGTEHVDYLFCHDVPKRVSMKSMFNFVVPENTRELIQEAVDTTKPLRVFSGHWHQRRDYRIPRKDGGESFGHCLNKEYCDDNVLFLDLITNEVINPPLRWNQFRRNENHD